MTRRQRRNSRNNRQRNRLYREQNGICHYCRQKIEFEDWSVDHVIPKCAGGTRHASNIVGACKDCNNKKGNKIPPMLLPGVQSNGIPELE